VAALECGAASGPYFKLAESRAVQNNWRQGSCDVRVQATETGDGLKSETESDYDFAKAPIRESGWNSRAMAQD
jgi:hypothetical protein